MTTWRISILLACLASSQGQAQEPQPLKVLDDLNGRTLPVKSIAFSRDGKAFASGSWGVVTIRDFPSMKVRIILRGHTQGVCCLAFSPDGAILASGTSKQSHSSPTLEVKLWDTATGKELAAWIPGTPNLGESVNGLAFSPDGKTVASATDQGQIAIWDVKTLKESSRLITYERGVKSLAFTADGETLLCVGQHRMSRWNVASGKKLKDVIPIDFVERTLGLLHAGGQPTLSSDGKTLVTGHSQQKGEAHQRKIVLKLWDVETGKVRRVLEVEKQQSLWSLALSEDGKLLAAENSDGQDRSVTVCDTGSGRQIATFKVDYATFLAFSPDSKTLVWGSSGRINLWDVATGKELLNVPAIRHSYANSLAFSPDGQTLVSATNDGLGSPAEIRLWNVKTGTMRQLLKDEQHVGSVVFTPDGKQLIVAGEESSRLWDLAAGKRLLTVEATSPVVSTPDGKLLALTTGAPLALRSGVTLWNAALGRKQEKTLPHGNVSCLAFSPDGKMLASGDDGWDYYTGLGPIKKKPVIKLWDVAGHKELRTLSGHTIAVYCLAFSPDGKSLVSSGGDGTVRRWDVETGKELATLVKTATSPKCVAFSPDGKLLAWGGTAWGGYDCPVSVWDVAAGKVRATYKDSVLSLAFSPDGKLLATGAGYGTVRLWQLAR